MFLNMKISAQQTSVEELTASSPALNFVNVPPARPNPIPQIFRPRRKRSSYGMDAGGSSSAASSGAGQSTTKGSVTNSEGTYCMDMEKDARVSTSVEVPLTTLTYLGRTSCDESEEKEKGGGVA